MESRRRRAILWILGAGRALGLMVPLRASGTGPDFAVLKRIGSRVDDRAGVISIEARSGCVRRPQPDPNTFVSKCATSWRCRWPTISRPILASRYPASG
jgi:hypothetical protein